MGTHVHETNDSYYELYSFPEAICDLYLYLASNCNLCKYVFSCNRLDYAQHIIEYISRVNSTNNKDPDLYNKLLSEDFTLTKNTVSFTGTGVDQGQ